MNDLHRTAQHNITYPHFQVLHSKIPDKIVHNALSIFPFWFNLFSIKNEGASAAASCTDFSRYMARTQMRCWSNNEIIIIIRECTSLMMKERALWRSEKNAFGFCSCNRISDVFEIFDDKRETWTQLQKLNAASKQTKHTHTHEHTKDGNISIVSW